MSPSGSTERTPRNDGLSGGAATREATADFVHAGHRTTTKREEVLFAQWVAVADGCVLIASYLIAYAIRERFLGAIYGPLYPLGSYIWILWVIIPSWIFLARRYDLHDPRTYSSPAALLSGQTRVHLAGGLLLLSAMYVSASWDVSRFLLELFIGVGFAASLVERGAIRIGLLWLFVQDASLRSVLIVGADSSALAFAQTIEASPHWRQRVVGFLVPEAKRAQSFSNHRVLGADSEIIGVLLSEVVDEVVVSPASVGEASLARIAAICAEFGVSFRTLVRMPESAIGGFRVEGVSPGLYLMSVETTSPGLFGPAAKRAFDIAGAVVGLIAYGVVYVWYARKLRRESPGSVLFRQERVGRNGRVFTLYKFRTMYPDAHKDLDFLRDQNQMDGFTFKLRDDPRVTPTGRRLRKTHLDELPQFWNVLRGEMSIVGTRPPTTDEVMRYAPRHHRRLSIKPGVTGLWQIVGNEQVSDFEEIVALDCEYIERRSIWLDIRIVARTISKVLRAEGW